MTFYESINIAIQKNKNHLIEKEKPMRINEPSKWYCWFDESTTIITNPESSIGIK